VVQSVLPMPIQRSNHRFPVCHSLPLLLPDQPDVLYQTNLPECSIVLPAVTKYIPDMEFHRTILFGRWPGSSIAA
jgi:hypothetical protein